MCHKSRNLGISTTTRRCQADCMYPMHFLRLIPETGFFFQYLRYRRELENSVPVLLGRMLIMLRWACLCHLVVVATARPPFSVTTSRIFPMLCVERSRPPQNTFLLSQKIIAHPQQPYARHGHNLQRASPNLWVSVFCSLFIVFHCILHCHCPVRLFFHCIERVLIVLNGFGVSGCVRSRSTN